MPISVTTHKDGFRRAGRTWTGTTTLEPDELSQEQWQQLNDDPMFDVQEVQVSQEGMEPEKTDVIDLVEGDDELPSANEPDPLIQQLVAAIFLLEKDNAEHFDKNNKPKIKALQNLTGVKKINAKMRDDAFKLFLKNL